MQTGKVYQITDAGRIGLGRAFTFEAGHRLEGYEGKCATPHGHSYHGRVLVSVPRTHADAVGIVLDFDVLKQAIKDCIIDVYDHNGILTNTAEVLVGIIAEHLQEWFTKATLAGSLRVGLHERKVPPDVAVERVVLYETFNSYAEWCRGGF